MADKASFNFNKSRIYMIMMHDTAHDIYLVPQFVVSEGTSFGKDCDYISECIGRSLNKDYFLTTQYDDDGNAFNSASKIEVYIVGEFSHADGTVHQFDERHHLGNLYDDMLLPYGSKGVESNE